MSGPREVRRLRRIIDMSEKIVQTAGRQQLGEFAPMFAHLNDDCVKIGLNRKSLIESRFRGAVLFL